MTSENQHQQEQPHPQPPGQQGRQNGHASPEIHLRGAEQHPRPEGEEEGLADAPREMEHVQDAVSKAEDPKELNGLMEVNENTVLYDIGANTLMRAKENASSIHFRRSGRG